MRELRLDIDGDAMERDPAPQAHPDRGDLVLMAGPLVRAANPEANAILAPFAADVEGIERADDPFFQPCHIGAYVRPAPLQVEHHVGHPLARAVIGELAAASGGEQRESWIEQVVLPAAGAGSVERRTLQQTYQF